MATIEENAPPIEGDETEADDKVSISLSKSQKKRNRKKKKKYEAASASVAAPITDTGAVNDETKESVPEETAANAEGSGSTKTKKKRNKKKGKGGKGAVAEPSLLPQSRLLGGFTDYYVKFGQSEPPTIPVSQLPGFSSGKFPEGEIMEHPGANNTYRITRLCFCLLNRFYLDF
jgi:methionyl aminopeptidase